MIQNIVQHSTRTLLPIPTTPLHKKQLHKHTLSGSHEPTTPAQNNCIHSLDVIEDAYSPQWKMRNSPCIEVALKQKCAVNCAQSICVLELSSTLLYC